jgi:hypothetical protein
MPLGEMPRPKWSNNGEMPHGEMPLTNGEMPPGEIKTIEMAMTNKSIHEGPLGKGPRQKRSPDEVLNDNMARKWQKQQLKFSKSNMQPSEMTKTDWSNTKQMPTHEITKSKKVTC